MTAKFNFELSSTQLHEIANAFESCIEQGLKDTQQELKCLPAYTPITEQIKSGEVCVLDLGGSNLRASKVVINADGLTTIKQVCETQVPWKRGVDFGKNHFLAVQAKLLEPYLNQQNLLGYCFSYPTQSLPSGDAKLVNWTKGVKVDGMEEQPVGSLLTQYIENEYGKSINTVAVINDTVASLLAGLTLTPSDAYFGVIAGTGSNIAGLYPVDRIGKLSAIQKQAYAHHRLPVNLESGNFNPPHLTAFDDIVDKTSENPGLQRFEKAVSGMYLGRIFKAAFSELDFDAESGAKGLVEFIDKQPSDCDYRNAALSLLKRSTQLVAAQLLGLINHYRKKIDYQVRHIRIVCEGGLFHSTSVLGPYCQLVEDELKNLLNKSIRSDIQVELTRVAQANLLGSAIAALACQ
ncbi:hypothetical protein [Catenovulum sediminis]|uniref:Hexokinase n=1 Tax=Catenovulum sediminis TaxID=1740262 RepID=A0ABV1RCR6_9ALTE